MSLKIIIAGYGRMGKTVEEEAKKRGHTVTLRLDKDDKRRLNALSSSDGDVVIEFTTPESAMTNFRTILGRKIPLVTGTTGWLDKLDEVRKLCDETGGSFLYSSNFSPGVNILFHLNKVLAEIMNQYPEYDPYLEEKHHKYKKDAPSGTAATLAEDLLDRVERKKRWESAGHADRAPLASELSMSWIRSGEIIGEHIVGYTSPVDEIKISHRAYNRRGFALGAVLAAEWLHNRKGFYNFSDIFIQQD